MLFTNTSRQYLADNLKSRSAKNSRSVLQNHKIPIFAVLDNAKTSQSVVQKQLLDTYKSKLNKQKWQKQKDGCTFLQKRIFCCFFRVAKTAGLLFKNSSCKLFKKFKRRFFVDTPSRNARTTKVSNWAIAVLWCKTESYVEKVTPLSAKMPTTGFRFSNNK